VEAVARRCGGGAPSILIPHHDSLRGAHIAARNDSTASFRVLRSGARAPKKLRKPLRLPPINRMETINRANLA